MASSGPPVNLTALSQRIRNLAGAGQAEFRLRRAVANVVVGQMLPAGAVKGGAAIKIRLGDAGSRFTADLDVARSGNLAVFVEELQQGLRAGWAGFTGRVVEVTPAAPVGIPPAYVMRPYQVKLDYRGRSWLTVPLEVGHDEIGDTESPDLAIAEDLLETFAQLSLPEPGPIAVLPIDHQIAQKLHACSAPDSQRAHDLVDLQLLATGLDRRAVGLVVRRLFRSRGAHPWPPVVMAHADWPALYVEAAEGLDVIGDVDGAVRWVNELIAEIDADSRT